MPPPDWRALGNAALNAGDLAQAARWYEQGSAAEPQDPFLHLNLGYVLLEQGRAAAAAEQLSQALALRRPEHDFAHEAHYLLGRAEAACGKPEQALVHFDSAARCKAGFAEPLEEAVRLLQSVQRPHDAVPWAERLLAALPSGDNVLLLAQQLAAAGAAEAALVVVDRLCAAEPANVNASVRRFDLLLGVGRFADALAEAERTLALTGPQPGPLANVAAALEKLGRLDEALARIEQALRIAPGHRGALVSRVAFLTQALRLPEAIALAGEALRVHPDDADLHWNLALAHLMRGEFEPGWREHEWRLRVPGLQHKVLVVAAPAWRGESLAGRTILLHGEQGFGDNIQFIRFVPEVAAKAGTVLLRVHEKLQPLFAPFLPANCHLLPPGAGIPAVDAHAPLMSLPALLGVPVESHGGSRPYLRPDAGAVAAWRERLAAVTGVRVGIAWCGNTAHANDHNRSVPLSLFKQLDTQGCSFVTIQPDAAEAEVAAEWPRVLNAGVALSDFADTAALVEALDLVVTVDTSVAHLAGALGKPVWILLPYAPDWRWMLERNDSPWYPSARLYRQGPERSWAEVLQRVRTDLRTFAEER